MYGFPVYDAFCDLPPGPVSRLRDRGAGAPVGAGRVFAVKLARGADLLDGPALLVSSWDRELPELSRSWMARDALDGFSDAMLRTQPPDAVTTYLENLAGLVDAAGTAETLVVDGRPQPGLRLPVLDHGWLWLSDELPITVAGSYCDPPELGRVDRGRWPAVP